jgi:hypothetical protein
MISIPNVEKTVFMHVNKKYGSYVVLLQLIRTAFCGMHTDVSHAIINDACSSLRNKNI